MNFRLKKLSDQVMVITGASSAIGLVTARLAAKRGVRLVLNARNEEALRSVVDEINAAVARRFMSQVMFGKFEDVQMIAGSLLAGLGLAAYAAWRAVTANSTAGAHQKVLLDRAR